MFTHVPLLFFFNLFGLCSDRDRRDRDRSRRDRSNSRERSYSPRRRSVSR